MPSFNDFVVRAAALALVRHPHANGAFVGDALERYSRVNVGVAAPMAYFPFNGVKNSFYGDLHDTGKDGVRFFTENKVEITRWLSDPTGDPRTVKRPVESGA